MKVGAAYIASEQECGILKGTRWDTTTNIHIPPDFEKLSNGHTNLRDMNCLIDSASSGESEELRQAVEFWANLYNRGLIRDTVSVHRQGPIFY